MLHLQKRRSHKSEENYLVPKKNQKLCGVEIVEENPYTQPNDEIDQIKTANPAYANPCFNNSAEPLEGGAGKGT